MEQVLTFEQLPEAVTILTKKVSELTRLIAEKQAQTPTDEPERFLNIEEAADFLRLAIPTVYSKVSRGELPVMKRSKRLYFSRTELLDYLKEGRKKSNAEIEAEAKAYLSNNKKALK